MKKTGLLSDVSGGIRGLAKQTGKTMVKTPKDLAKIAKIQLGVVPESRPEEDLKKPQEEQAQKPGETVSSDQTKEVVNYLYGAKKLKEDKSMPLTNALGIDSLKAEHFGARDQTGISQIVKPQKSNDDQQKLSQLRQHLHGEYYQKLINPKKEERAAEKVEREEDEKKMEDLQQEKKKKKPIAVTMGEQRVEKFRGSSG